MVFSPFAILKLCQLMMPLLVVWVTLSEVALGIVIETPPETTDAPCGLASAVPAPSAMPAASARTLRAICPSRFDAAPSILIYDVSTMGEPTD